MHQDSGARHLAWQRIAGLRSESHEALLPRYLSPSVCDEAVDATGSSSDVEAKALGGRVRLGEGET